MRGVVFARNSHEVGQALESGFEVIVEPQKLSRLGKLAIEEVNDLLSKYPKELYVQWDILMTENEFTSCVEEVKLLNLQNAKALRVQDPGTVFWSISNLDCDLHIICETGNHNLEGLRTWRDISPRVKRLVISNELSKDTLKEYKQTLACELEVQAAGPILLFYTPRNLLSALIPEDDEKRAKQQNFLYADAESEESPHKGFPIVENQHGTFMFHIKRLFLFDQLESLQETQIDYSRIDLRLDEDIDFSPWAYCLKSQDYAKKFVKELSYDSIRGFFNINKSDVLFKKLKNHRLQRKDNKYVGEILEVIKGDSMALDIKGSALKFGDQLNVINPDGKQFEICVSKITTLDHKCLDTTENQKLVLINHKSGIWPKSQIYLA